MSSPTRTWGRVGNWERLFWFRGPLPSSSGPADPEGHHEILGGPAGADPPGGWSEDSLLVSDQQPQLRPKN